MRTKEATSPRATTHERTHSRAPDSTTLLPWCLALPPGWAAAVTPPLGVPPAGAGQRAVGGHLGIAMARLPSRVVGARAHVSRLASRALSRKSGRPFGVWPANAFRTCKLACILPRAQLWSSPCCCLLARCSRATRLCAAVCALFRQEAEGRAGGEAAVGPRFYFLLFFPAMSFFLPARPPARARQRSLRAAPPAAAAAAAAAAAPRQASSWRRLLRHA